MTTTTPPLDYLIKQERLYHPRRGGMAEVVISIDPGETTGVALMLHDVLFAYDQIKTSTPEADALLEWLRDMQLKFEPNPAAPARMVAVIESYRVFSWKTKQHAWAGLHTPQLIGALRMWFRLCQIPVVLQSPQVAKGFVTDQKLKDWDLWIKGQKHARDAIRHAIYFQIFGVIPK